MTVGLAGDFGNLAIDCRDPKVLDVVMKWLRPRRWFAFNTIFDGQWVARFTQEMPKIVGCTMVMFKLLATEGWMGQRWQLENLIDNVLGWANNNKQALNDLLTKHNLSKAEMSKLADLEPKNFLLYCAQDTEAAYQGMMHLRKVCYDKGFTQLINIHDQLFRNAIELNIEQTLKGIAIDEEGLLAYEEDLKARTEELRQAFENLPETKGPISERNTRLTKEWHAPIRGSKKIWARKGDEPWLNIEEWTRGEKKSPVKWEQEYGCWYKEITTVKPRTRKRSPKLFNMASTKDLRWLFYGDDQRPGLVDYEILRVPDPENEKPWLRIGQVGFRDWETGNEVEWDMTKGGQLPVDKKVMTFWGKPGQVFRAWSKWNRVLMFVEKLKERVENGRYYPDVKMHGTVTGRGSGGSEDSDAKVNKLNIQQLVKDDRFLSLLIADKGTTVIQTDFTSLEDVVIAEASKDPVSLEVYGSGKPHDGYLYRAIKLDPKGSDINEVYNIENPTTTSVGLAKKQFKGIRSIYKVDKLASNYGAGAEKKRRELMLAGVWLTKEESKNLHRRSLELGKGLKAWEEELKNEWEMNGGYIMNGLHRPICVPHYLLKDIKNRFCQSTGHDILLIFLFYVNKFRKELGLHNVMRPWHYDNHDETFFQVRKGYENNALHVFKKAYELTNNYLKGDIKITGDIEFGNCIWDFKAG